MLLGRTLFSPLIVSLLIVARSRMGNWTKTEIALGIVLLGLVIISFVSIMTSPSWGEEPSATPTHTTSGFLERASHVGRNQSLFVLEQRKISDIPQAATMGAQPIVEPLSELHGLALPRHPRVLLVANGTVGEQLLERAYRERREVDALIQEVFKEGNIYSIGTPDSHFVADSTSLITLLTPVQIFIKPETKRALNHAIQSLGGMIWTLGLSPGELNSLQEQSTTLMVLGNNDGVGEYFHRRLNALRFLLTFELADGVLKTCEVTNLNPVAPFLRSNVSERQQYSGLPRELMAKPLTRLLLGSRQYVVGTILSTEAVKSLRSVTLHIKEETDISPAEILDCFFSTYDLNKTHGILRSIPPKYPTFARKRGLQGTTIVRVIVSPNGTPRLVKTLKTSGHAVLDNAGIEAVRQWRFTPEVKDGSPVSKIIDIPLKFTVDRTSGYYEPLEYGIRPPSPIQPDSAPAFSKKFPAEIDSH